MLGNIIGEGFRMEWSLLLYRKGDSKGVKLVVTEGLVSEIHAYVLFLDLFLTCKKEAAYTQVTCSIGQSLHFFFWLVSHNNVVD